MPLLGHIEHKEHIIWDWNGTILDDVDYAITVINGLLEKQALPALSREEYKNVFGFPIKDFYDRLGFNYDTQSFESLCHEFVDKYMAGVGECQPVGKIDAHLRAIKASGKKQSVLSATAQADLDTMIQHFAYQDLFDHVYGIDNKLAASKVARGKALLAHAATPAEKTVLIGDTLHDLEVGEALGIDVILITHGHHCHKKLSTQHETVISIL